MGALEGRVAIVTGAGKGIGKQVAIKYAEEGAAVVLASIDVPPKYILQDVADLIIAKGGKALAVICDQAYEDQIEAVVKATIDNFGKVDILANIAQGGLDRFDSLDTMTKENALHLYTTGPLAYAHFIQKCMPYMKKQRYGRIINFGSAGELGGVGTLSYAMAKGAVDCLTRCAAHELGRYNIMVNTVWPLVTTGESTSSCTNDQHSIKDNMLLNGPCGYVGRPYEDIAPTMVFLGSENCRYLQGQRLSLDGGAKMTL